MPIDTTNFVVYNINIRICRVQEEGFHMTDLMGWLYDHYIHPQIENQPQDDSDELHFSILESALMEAEKQDLEYVCRLYAVQGFRAGVKFGLALGEDLREI